MRGISSEVWQFGMNNYPNQWFNDAKLGHLVTMQSGENGVEDAQWRR
jgi:hypothetical protein